MQKDTKITMDADEVQPLIVYGHDFCSQARTVRRNLEKAGVPFEWRDVRSGDPQYQEELRALTGGFLSVPTIQFPDGEVLVEPRAFEVMEKVGSPNKGTKDDRSLLDRLLGR